MIYLSPPFVSGNEKQLVDEAIDSNWIAPLGPHVEAFEVELAETVGVDRALATSTGTAALHLALDVLGVGPGDVVLGPTFTFIGGVSPIRYVGAEPWFVDASASTWNMDPALLDTALQAAEREGRRVGAVIAVDLFGQCADYESIEAICERYEVPLIEDAAEALGATG
ncbi:MAG: DegT/DnrJ/EryC1/StrS aminotransferase family protein, partial [Actinomycetia bacterium]|nr:DegT/DnrJ/EryC1/StrS aminotransferase family protein [Actinomycetes bacterium]